MINFGSGPAQFPKEVLEKIQAGLKNYKQSGASILELPHRGEWIQNMIHKANRLVREILELPDNFKVLWMQGGGRMQFHLLPLNFLKKDQNAQFVVSGHWAKQAYLEALRQGKAEIIASSEAISYTSVPSINTEDIIKKVDKNTAYLYYCSNNTIYGTQIKHFARHPNVPLIADMSSDIFTRRLNFSNFDMLFAVAQKNIGAAGVTMVIIKEEFLQKANINLPDILSYKAFSQQNSTVNTPPVFSIFTAVCMLEWIKEKELKNLEKENLIKARRFYDFLDNSTHFEGTASKESRSFTNITFRLKNRSIDETEEILNYLKEKSIFGVAGHRFIGGFRIALYNGITLENVEKLIAILALYEKEIKGL
ncbi:MAG TPA: 3-phosphoserine/phosphohydroxythreonine transaminase [Chitinophagaceae bacterium]|nr:3-phosphoserine/phosphohydroxythreonine transaminase [Chitinophagaceae bacterium]